MILAVACKFYTAYLAIPSGYTPASSSYRYIINSAGTAHIIITPGKTVTCTAVFYVPKYTSPIRTCTSDYRLRNYYR